MNAFPEPIQTSRPFLPPRDQLIAGLDEIYANRWLTNNGPLHQRFELQMKRFLGQEHLCLLANGTLALEAAFAVHGVSGEVITTPFTFAATTHAIVRSGCQPVFADVDPNTYNLSPEAVRSKLTARTGAILATHCFGIPCAHEELAAIARQAGVPLIYDAAHALGVRVDGNSISCWGDSAIFSLHATKLVHACEGGVLTLRTAEDELLATRFRNFGFTLGARDVVLPGTNAKMSELHALMGSLTLKHISEIIGARREVDRVYRKELSMIPGIRPYQLPPANVEHNFAYMAIEVDPDPFGMDRDGLREHLATHNVVTRPYFNPLTSRFDCYRGEQPRTDLPVADALASKVLCLPIYHDLELETVEAICELIREAGPAS